MPLPWDGSAGAWARAPSAAAGTRTRAVCCPGSPAMREYGTDSAFVTTASINLYRTFLLDHTRMRECKSIASRRRGPNK